MFQVIIGLRFQVIIGLMFQVIIGLMNVYMYKFIKEIPVEQKTTHRLNTFKSINNKLGLVIQWIS